MFYNHKKHKNFSSGFTLIEIMVTIAIIAVMAIAAGMSLTSTRSSNRADAAQAELASQIRLAQTYALQGRMQGSSTPCGYGVVFNADNKTYYLYYNSAASGTSCEAVNNGTDADYLKRGTHKTDIDTQTLSYGCMLDRGSISPNPVDDYEIYFTVPHAKVYSYGGTLLGSSITIPLKCNGVARSITVTAAGMVNANN